LVIDSTFVTSSAKPEQFPSDGLPEIAFLGRSNVGKSSLINALLGYKGGRKGLAFTSSTPGRTQTLNFYRINGSLYFVDLPGYGYTKVSKDLAGQWQELIECYLLNRKTLDLSFLILDARRGWMDRDLQLKQWLELHNRRYQVIATKTDKLKNQSDKEHGLAQIRKEYAEPLLFSASTGRGVREIWQVITKTLRTR
jgi:GTP-binding protein